MLWLTAWLTVWSLFTSPLLYVTHAPPVFHHFRCDMPVSHHGERSGLSSSCPWVVEPGRPVLVGANWRAEQTAGEELCRGATVGNTEERKTDKAQRGQDRVRRKDRDHHCISRNYDSVLVNVNGWWNNVENILFFNPNLLCSGSRMFKINVIKQTKSSCHQGFTLTLIYCLTFKQKPEQEREKHTKGAVSSVNSQSKTSLLETIKSRPCLPSSG